MGKTQAKDLPVHVGIDVGGTFTDFVVWGGGEMRIHKVPTTPDDQSRAILQGLRELGLLGDGAPAPAIVHGMTVATNALLERRGARTAYLTTQGFADVPVIGRQNRPHLYQLHQTRPAPLAADGLRFEVVERLDATGQVLADLDESGLEAVAVQLREGGAESLAIVFLFSYRNPRHERRAAELLQARLPGLPISLSSEVLPEYREYERAVTTLIDAYVQPLVANYLARLAAALAQGSAAGAVHAPAGKRGRGGGGVRPESVRIMQSNGGLIDLRQASGQAARLVLSGPAGGAVGAFAVAQQAEGHGQEHTGATTPHVLTFDMGGTSTDVCLCPGRVPTTGESTITGLPLRLPMIDIHTVGAGGGSIAYVDAGGALQVGPQSAGAVPGPACYGRGGMLPTVTDANLVLSRLDPQGFLGGAGDVQLDEEAARRVLAALGAELGLTAEAAALGVIRVANATMERALRAVSVEQGVDPRNFALLPFGGAGPLHACELAEALAIRRILCPIIPGVLSAYGMLAAELSAEYATAVLCPVATLLADPSPLLAAASELVRRTAAALGEGRGEGAQSGGRISAALDLRYRGQSYELSVPLEIAPALLAWLLAGEHDVREGAGADADADTGADRDDEVCAALQGAAAAFHAAHAQRYGYAMPDEPLEAVTLRLHRARPGAGIRLPLRPPGGLDPDAARLPDRDVWFAAGGPLRTPCYRRDRLQPQNRIVGPALVLQYDSTLLLGPGWQAVVDPAGNLLCESNV